jgi:hypothetical protein
MPVYKFESWLENRRTKVTLKTLHHSFEQIVLKALSLTLVGMKPCVEVLPTEESFEK